ncbi:MAG: hypothetical protein A2W31_19005 [Planctomycetes bacterium RBG_16_64_10]|nr:MAG: hypothetical protein A2W31_19005 [Planctomycetes bacterium RBG_16_64_10]
MFDHFVMQIFRREIRVVLPMDRVQHVRDLEATEDRSIFERFEHGSPQGVRQIDDSFFASIESHSDPVPINVLSFCNLKHR